MVTTTSWPGIGPGRAGDGMVGRQVVPPVGVAIEVVQQRGGFELRELVAREVERAPHRDRDLLVRTGEDLGLVVAIEALKDLVAAQLELGVHEALDVLASRKATMYDPAVVDAFFAMHAAEPGLLVGAPQTAPTPGTGQPAGTLASRSERSSLDLVTFFELGRTLGGRPEDARTGVALHARLRGHLPRGALVLYVYDSGSDAIVAAWEAGDAGFGALPGTRIPVGERLSGWVAATGEPVRNSDARLDLDEQARERSPFRSTLAVRLADGDRVLGVLAAYASEPNAFDDRHACLIEAAGAVLVAIGLDRVWSVRDLSA